jgi:hypothetical protein
MLTDSEMRLELLFNVVDVIKKDLAKGLHENWTFADETLYFNQKPIMSCKAFHIEYFREPASYRYRISLKTGEEVRGYVTSFENKFSEVGH